MNLQLLRHIFNLYICTNEIYDDIFTNKISIEFNHNNQVYPNPAKSIYIYDNLLRMDLNSNLTNMFSIYIFYIIVKFMKFLSVCLSKCAKYT